MEPIKYHYYLVCGEVVFKDKEHEEFHRYPINGLIKGSNKNITVRHLANAQKVLQINFRQTVKEDENIEIVDCIIHALSYLGEMADEEFQDVKLEEPVEKQK